MHDLNIRVNSHIGLAFAFIFSYLILIKGDCGRNAYNEDNERRVMSYNLELSYKMAILSTRPKSYVSSNKRSSLNLRRHKREFGSSHEKSDVWPRPQGVRLSLAKSNPVFCLYQRPLCVVERLGRKKERARRARWEREREKRGLFPLPIVPRALSIFQLLLFLLGHPARASAGEKATS